MRSGSLDVAGEPSQQSVERQREAFSPREAHRAAARDALRRPAETALDVQGE
jgi:hypothetical protein